MAARLALVLVIVGVASPALADLDPLHPVLNHCAVTDCDKDMPTFAWQGESRSVPVTFVSRASGAHLYGRIFAPVESASVEGSHPGVLILPGSGGAARETHYRWSARDLAGHGYVAFTIDPQGVGQSETTGHPPCAADAPDVCPGVPFQQFDVWLDAAQSGLDFFLSKENPHHDLLDKGQVGAAGHSMGARAVSVLQDVDDRVRAVVAWDNLASSSEGDRGSASGGPPIGSLLGAELPSEGRPVTPRRPAMGHASDGGGAQANSTDPEIKKTAYREWREAGVPAMELVFRDKPHGKWAQTNIGPQTGTEAELYLFEHYTRAWFDLWLREDASGLDSLFAEEVDGVARADFLSESYRSAAFIPDAGPDCDDFARCA